jgi:hypothetical protein
MPEQIQDIALVVDGTHTLATGSVDPSWLLAGGEVIVRLEVPQELKRRYPELTEPAHRLELRISRIRDRELADK